MQFTKQKRTGPVLFSGYKRGEGIKKALEIGRENILFELKNSKLKGNRDKMDVNGSFNS